MVVDMNSKFENLIIFELANNHQGSVKHGMQIIRILGEECRKYKINAAVKFQYRDLDTIIHPDYRNRTDIKHISRFLSTRLSMDAFYSMVCAVRDEGMTTMCTPFDEASVDICIDHGIDIIKIASCSATDWPLLETVAETKRPVIISTGGKTFSDIDNIYSFFIHRFVDFGMMHCVGLYPASNEFIQLNCLTKMQNRYPDIPIGYSGHEDPSNLSIVQMAVAKGAQMLERHVGLATEDISLNRYSTDVRNIGSWIQAVCDARTICGQPEQKIISNQELQSMKELSRGCYAAVSISKGQAIEREDVFFAMPCASDQLTSCLFKSGLIATKNYDRNEGIYEIREVSLVSDIRSVVHDIKGMLYEAKIAVGSQFELELSHHYGMEHFRHYGTTMINIINREYCKKLLIILPGQQHPQHFHKIKEESFQVLSGIMTLTLEDTVKTLKAGDIITVERGIPHSFTSTSGCIFEEISTTHVPNDSYYTDKKIAQLDSIERKTILKDW